MTFIINYFINQILKQDHFFFFISISIYSLDILKKYEKVKSNIFLLKTFRKLFKDKVYEITTMGRKV